MTRVIVAPDSFKGTMTAVTACEALAAGVRDAGAQAVSCPLADGGEGTAVVLARVFGGEWVEAAASGPLGDPLVGAYLLTGPREKGRIAVIDTATASGLDLVPPDRRDAEAASSRGTGELVAAAAARGVRHILLGVGGSACTDGGLGALVAIEAGGGLRGATITVLCDVGTVFEDAAAVYGPQKGADAAAVERLTARLHRVAGTLPRDPRGVPRGGAAGGLSGALWARYDAELTAGIETVLDAVGFDALLAGAAGVITGEGRLDGQTAEGKVVSGVARRGATAGVPVHAVVGRAALRAAQVRALGLAGVVEAGDPEALRRAAASVVAGLG